MGYTPLVNALGGEKVYNSLIPREVALPAVVFSYAGGGDDNLTPRRAIRVTYLVKAVADTLEEAGNIAQHIDAALHHQELDVAGWGNYWLAREAWVRFLETDPAGRTYGHAGGLYEIRLVEV